MIGRISSPITVSTDGTEGDVLDLSDRAGLTAALATQTIAVLGGSGFIGQHVVDRLAPLGVRVVSVARSEHATAIASNTASGDVDLVRASLGSAELAQVFEGVDTVICLASSSLPSAPDLLAEISDHVGSTIASATLAAKAGVRRFIFASSGGTVYGVDSDTPIHEDSAKRPRNGYGASKLAIEHYLRLLAKQTDMTTLSLRVSNPFGEGQDGRRGQGFVGVVMRHLYANGDLSIWGDGSAVRDFVDVNDVADAFIQAATYDGPPTEVNVASGHGRSLFEVLGTIEQVTGKRATPNFESERSVDVATNVLNIERAERIMGWKPQIPFEAGIARTAQWWESSQSSQSD